MADPSNEVLQERIDALKANSSKQGVRLELLDTRVAVLDRTLFAAKVIAGVLGISSAGLFAFLFKLNNDASRALATAAAAETAAMSVKDSIEELTREATIEIRDATNAAILAIDAKEKALGGALEDRVESLVSFSFPVGVVVPWPGTEAPPGWAICEGQSFAALPDCDVEGLRHALGSPESNPYGPDRLPDYRGLFLRGVNRGRAARGDLDSMNRLDHGFGGTPGDRGVGSTQLGATAMPNARFRSSKIGKFDATVPHEKNRWQSFVGAGGPQIQLYDFDSQTLAIPDHQHSLEGGDAETRPANVAVNWIIRVQRVR